MARSRKYEVEVGADVRPFKKAMSDASGSVAKFTRATNQKAGRAFAGDLTHMASGALLATGAVGGLAIGAKKLVDAYSESEKSSARLQAQLKASGISYKNHAKEIDNVIQKTSRLSALDDEDLQDAFTNIIRVTGNVSKSMKLTGLAADFARAKHIDVAKAGEIVGKVAGGNIGILSRYGIQIDKGATSTQALGALQQKFAGQAEAYGKTNAGAMDRLHVAFQNLEESAGKALAPALTKGANAASKFLTQMENGTGQGGRFVEKLRDIRDTVEPIAKKFIDTAGAIGKFAGKHGDLVKVGAAVVGIGLALKGLKFVSAITGFTNLIGVARASGKGIARVMGQTGMTAGQVAADNVGQAISDNLPRQRGKIRAALSRVFTSGGTAAGAAAAENAAEGMANEVGPSLGARKGKFAVAGRGVGAVMGTALATGAIIVAGAALEKWLSQLNDKLSTKGGIVGFLGKVSNIGEWIAKNLPGPTGDVTRVILKDDPKPKPKATPNRPTGIGTRPHGAGGGRVYGPVKGADSVPAVLSPDEFVVTGGGEQMLESMTFPGVLDWLGGAQPSHFRDGGRAPKRMATGGRVGSAIAAARRAGFSGANLVNMIAIAGRESHYDPNAVNIGPRDHSIGLWQINQLAHKGKFGSDAQLKDPFRNAKAAYALFKAAGLSPWNHAGGPLGGTNVEAARRAVLGSRGGGSGATSAGGPRPSGDQVFAGFQAASQGESLRQFLGAALDYVGEPHRLKDTPVASSAGAMVGGAPPAVNAMLARAKKYAFGPYDYGGGHGGFGTPGAKGGFDCSGYVSAILGPGVLSSPMAVVQPMASALQSGEGQYVTVGMRGSSGKSAHTMVKIGNQYFESGGGHGAAKVGGWNGSFSKYHPAGLRRGGRVGGRRGFRFGGRGMPRQTGVTRSGRRGPSESTIRRLLGTISTGSPSAIKGALRTAQTYMAAHPNMSALRGWISAANKRARGATGAGQRGLQSFVALAQAEVGRQIANPVTAVDAAEGLFDQSNTDLQNELAANRAGDAATAGALGAQSTAQLQQLYADRATIATQLNRARRSGSRQTVAALTTRLGAQDSAIKAKRAEIVGYQDQYTSATTGDTSAGDALQQAIEDNTAAQKAHTDALVAVQTAIDNQTKTAAALNTTTGNQALRYLADYMSNQIGAGVTQRARTAGTGAIAVNY